MKELEVDDFGTTEDPCEHAVCMSGGVEYYEHDWHPGDIECRRCGADLSEWNDEEDQ